MQFTINLATRIYVNTRKVNFAIATAIALLLCGAIVSGMRIASTAADIKRVRAEVAVIEQRHGASVNEREYRALLTKIQFANGIIAGKSYDWLSLLHKLEEVVPDGVAVTSLSPDPKTSLLRLSGMARDFSTVRRLMESMETTRNFTEVYLLGHSESQVGQSQRGITFQVSCKVAPT